MFLLKVVVMMVIFRANILVIEKKCSLLLAVGSVSDGAQSVS